MCVCVCVCVCAGGLGCIHYLVRAITGDKRLLSPLSQDRIDCFNCPERLSTLKIDIKAPTRLCQDAWQMELTAPGCVCVCVCV